jgi:hypothetical protein
MDNDDCKTWMLKRGECEELHCPHLFTAPAMRDDPAERVCTCPGACPHGEPAQERFEAVREEFMSEALAESWEELIGPIEALLDRHGGSREHEAVDALVHKANRLIDAYALKVLEHRHEL